MRYSAICLFVFFSNHTSTTEIYTLSLHDALPISVVAAHSLLGVAALLVADDHERVLVDAPQPADDGAVVGGLGRDRKSTRLNSSHEWISYAVFCLKKKKKRTKTVDNTAS